MSIEVDLDDNGTINDVEDTLAYIRDEITVNVAAELEETWQKIKDAAIELCPKETGALASSIMLESEGGGGGIYSGFQAISVSGNAGGTEGEFYSNSIFAGDASIINPISGEPTDLYALFVHDGHSMRDGGFYNGVPFLTDAVDMYQSELDDCVNKALDEMGISNSEE